MVKSVCYDPLRKEMHFFMDDKGHKIAQLRDLMPNEYNADHIVHGIVITITDLFCVS